MNFCQTLGKSALKPGPLERLDHHLVELNAKVHHGA